MVVCLINFCLTTFPLFFGFVYFILKLEVAQGGEYSGSQWRLEAVLGLRDGAG